MSRSGVGVGAGVGAVELCRRLLQAYPEVQITAGGGVRDMSDVHRLEQVSAGDRDQHGRNGEANRRLARAIGARRFIRHHFTPSPRRMNGRNTNAA